MNLISPFRTLPEIPVFIRASTSIEISDAHIKNLRTAAMFALLVEEIKMKCRGGLQWHGMPIEFRLKKLIISI
jgi:hypothetical protein